MNASTKKQEIQLLLQSNKINEAKDASDNLCKLSPEDPEVWLISAGVHAQLGELTQVIECCKKTIQLQPNNYMAHYNLAVAFQSIGNFSAAEESFQTTLKLNQNMHQAWVALGYVIIQLGREEEAINLYNNLLKSPARNDPNITLSSNINISLALNGQKRFSEAEQACNSALAINPNSATALNNLGQALKGQGKMNRATKAHLKAVDVEPGFIMAHSNYLLDLNYLTNVDAKEIYLAHCKWEIQHTSNLSVKQHLNTDNNPNRRIRIGYVSADFRAHSVILFIDGLIESHNRKNVEIYCYSDVKLPDVYTEKISRTADHWREICNLDDKQLASIIETDKIDILVDLAGHTANNRLLAFAQKPAPIQVTWLGYPNTTGLTTIDYRLTDKWADPPDASDKYHTETLVRLPNGFLCYKPLRDSPPVNSLPITENGYITFGSFNNSAKVNTDIIKLWARILHQLPESRLVLKSPQLSDPPLKQQYLAAFKQEGIEPRRIDVYGRVESTVGHLLLYQQVDIALDPFPYNGTTTTCEALWMGAPVVTMNGNTHASRVGVSLLTNIGLTELIATTNDDYVRICIELANNKEHLAELRKSMRYRLKNSALLNATGFAEDIEKAYRDMWELFCKK